MANTLLSNRLRSASSGSGSSPPRQLNGVAGCFDYGAPIVLQQTDLPSTDPISDFGTGTGPVPWSFTGCNIIPAVGLTATSGLATGAAPTPGIDTSDVGVWGVGNYSPPPLGTLLQDNSYALMWETLPNELAFVTCGAGDWIVNQYMGGSGTPGSNLVWTDTYVVLVDVTGTPKKVIGHKHIDPSIGPFVTEGICTMVVPGKATLLGSTDRIVVLLVFSCYWNAQGSCGSGSGSGSGSGAVPNFPGAVFSHDNQIITPMYNIKAVFPALKLRDASGSGSGRRRALYGIARGCGPYKLAKKLRGARAVSGSGSGSGHRERAVWGYADCCAPFSGSSGSGGGGGGFQFGGGCGPTNPCGPPQSPGNLGGGCDMTGYPSTVLLHVSKVHEGTDAGTGACGPFPDSFTVPLWFFASPVLPIPDPPFTDPLNPAWVGWYINPFTGGLRGTQPFLVYCVLYPCGLIAGGGLFGLDVFPAVNPSTHFDLLADTAGSDETAAGLDLIFGMSNFWVNAFCQTNAHAVVTR